MAEQTYISSEGVKYRLIGTRKTTPITDSDAKIIKTQTVQIEVLVSDSVMRYMGSQFGHVAISIDNDVYTRAHETYRKLDKYSYIHDSQQIKMKRDTLGIFLRVSPDERNNIKGELERRLQLDKEFRLKHSEESSYSIINNNCSSNVADVLENIGVQSHDPRFFNTPITPAELASVLRKSKRVVKTHLYEAEKP